MRDTESGNKKAFVLYADIVSQLKDLTDEQMGVLFRAILVYVDTGNEMDMDAVTRMAFRFIVAQIDRDHAKYKDKCEKSKAAAQKRWDAMACERMRTDANASDGIPENADAFDRMHTDTDPDTDPDTDNNIKGEKKRTRFVPPTVDDVKAYVREKGTTLDAERFVDFYSSKGWYVGKNKMKDWRAAVRNWASRDRTAPKKNNFTVVDGRDNSGKYAALENAILGRA